MNIPTNTPSKVVQTIIGVGIALCFCIPIAAFLVIQKLFNNLYIFLCQFNYTRMFKMIAKTILFTLLAVVCVFTLKISVTAYSEFDEAREQYKSEGECIKKLIAQGHERIDIGTSNGTCYYIPNGYYK